MDLFNFPDRLPVAATEGILHAVALWLNATPVWNYTTLACRYRLIHPPPPRMRLVWQSAPRLSDIIENEDWSIETRDVQTPVFIPFVQEVESMFGENCITCNRHVGDNDDDNNNNTDHNDLQ
jgi:hypothetical protein